MEIIIKFYDTCSLLLAGESAFENNEQFIISSITLKELERIKTAANKDSDIKYSARLLLHLLEKYPNNYFVKIHQTNYEYILDEMNFDINDDAKILSDAWDEFKTNKYLEFITNDLSLKHIALCLFPKENVSSIEEDLDTYNGIAEIATANEELISKFYENPNYNHFNLKKGQYLLLKNPDNFDELIDVRVWTGETYRYLKFPTFDSTWFGKVQPYQGDIYQKCAFDSLANNKITLLQGPAGTGKAQPNSTLIPTKNGYVKLGDIKVGDFVLDRFGNETQVLAVYPQGLKENYKISFSDGRTAYCNNEHLWSCYTSKGNLKQFTVQEMINSGLQTKCGDWKYKIPASAPVEYPEKHFKIDPYVIGAFLGNGCCKQPALTISSNDEEIVSEIAQLIGAVSYKKESKFNYNWTFCFREKIDTNVQKAKTRFQTKEFFKDYSSNLIQLAQNKSIPEEYKFGSIQQRYSLIQGLMDTDGHIDNAKKGRTSFSSTSLKLITDLQEICWSLGMSASISEDRREEKYTEKICYRLTISCEKENKPNLFRLKRKKNIAIDYSNNNIKSLHSNKLTIKSIEKMPNLEEMTCILVDNKEHLYLTEQYVVTHNTYISLAFLMYMLERNRIDKIIIFCNTVATINSAKLGFYPGTKDDKLLDSQIGNMLSAKLGGKEGVLRMMEEDKLVLLPFSDIRGYDTSGMNAGIYITEAQNLDRTLIKLALQRIGEDCICIIDGDAKTQVDSLAYSGNNNGMRRMSKIFRGSDIYGEVTLNNIHRSKIAELAELI